jgi:DsbC/DsbD-like thiol-disulfide interchange protein
MLLAAGVSAVVAAPDAPAQGAKKSDSVVKAAATADKPDAQGRQTVTVTLMIEKPWHVYANKLPSDDFPGLPTVVTIDGKPKPEEVKVDYPTGKVVKDKTLGDYHVYEDRVEIKAQVRRNKGDTGPLTVSVQVQACSDKQCLLHSTLKVNVD